MEGLTKLVELLSNSIKSLRWWAFALAVISAYLKYAPEKYQPFISQKFLSADDRVEWLGVSLFSAAVVFLLGWCAAAIDAVMESRQYRQTKLAAVIQRRDQMRAERRKRKASDRLTHIKEDRIIRGLSRDEQTLLKKFLEQPNGILKVRNDVPLDIATLLTTKGVVDRIRPWYNDHGHVVGEVFVLREWVKKRVT